MNKPLADAIRWAEFWNEGKDSDGTFIPLVHLRALLAAARAQVPREPTEAMIDAAAIAGMYGNWKDGVRNTWRAMYDASPINALHDTED